MYLDDPKCLNNFQIQENPAIFWSKVEEGSWRMKLNVKLTSGWWFNGVFTTNEPSFWIVYSPPNSTLRYISRKLASNDTHLFKYTLTLTQLSTHQRLQFFPRCNITEQKHQTMEVIPFLIPESQFQIRAESDVYSSEEGFMSKQQNCHFCKDKRSYNDALDSPSLL